MTNYKHNPLFHVSKRANMKSWVKWTLRICALGVSLILCGIISYGLTKQDFGFFYKQLFESTFGNENRILSFFEEIAILLCIALAVTPAFKMKFWNIGAEGQVLVGALMCATCMYFLKSYFTSPGVIVIALICSIVAGVIWAVIPAIFKATWNTNETLFTLMMNYLAMKIVQCCLSVYVKSGSGVIKTSMMTVGRLPLIGDMPYLLNIIIVGILTIFMAIYLRYTKHGYELFVVGESINTAKYVGINVKKVIIRTMILSGAICGIAGWLIVSGASYTVNQNIVGGRGFTAILVSWLAFFDPFYMIITSFLVCFLEKGAASVASLSGLGTPFPEVITGVFFICFIAVEYFINYRIDFRKKEKKDSISQSNQNIVNIENLTNESDSNQLSTFEKKNDEEVHN